MTADQVAKKKIMINPWVPPPNAMSMDPNTTKGLNITINCSPRPGRATPTICDPRLRTMNTQVPPLSSSGPIATIILPTSRPVPLPSLVITQGVLWSSTHSVCDDLCQRTQRHRIPSLNSVKVRLHVNALRCAHLAQAECGSKEDIYYFSPWRAPGSAPVIDACGVAGGRHLGQGPGGAGADYMNTSLSKEGDLGSQVRSPPGGFYLCTPHTCFPPCLIDTSASRHDGVAVSYL